MKKIYFVRHAQSQANVDGIIAGSEFETPLTEEGKQQAKATGKYLSDKKIQLIVASPMQRTQQTAKIIARETGIEEAKILINELLTERAFGPYSGRPFTEYVKDTEKNRIKNGIETTEQLFNRVEKMIKWLQQRDEDSIVIVSHGATGKMFRLVDKKLHHADFHTIQRFDNAEVDEFTL